MSTDNTFFIPLGTPSSKNGRVWTGSSFVASEATQKWRKRTKKYWLEQKEKFLQAISELPQPYDIEFTFIRATKHKFDYVNPLQTVLDEMTHYGWIEDDNADIVRPFFGYYSYDKNKAGVIIKILNTKNDL